MKLTDRIRSGLLLVTLAALATVAGVPGAQRRVALGFSLGSAVLLDVIERLQPPPDAIVLAGAFASAREMAVATGLVPAWAAWALPDLWNNEARLAELAHPRLLIVHSRADEVVPLADALRLCRAARGPRALVLVDGLRHDAPLVPALAAPFWQPVIDAVRAGAPGAGELAPCG